MQKPEVDGAGERINGMATVKWKSRMTVLHVWCVAIFLIQIPEGNTGLKIAQVPFRYTTKVPQPIYSTLGKRCLTQSDTLKNFHFQPWILLNITYLCSSRLFRTNCDRFAPPLKMPKKTPIWFGDGGTGMNEFANTSLSVDCVQGENSPNQLRCILGSTC